MSIERFTVQLRSLMNEMLQDLEKAEKGNQTAAQRVRTHSIAFGKIAKEWRKLSIAQGKKKPGKTKTAAKPKKAAVKAPKAKAAKPKVAKAKSVKKAPRATTKVKKSTRKK